MKQKRNIFWFVEPLDSSTNEIMARYLSLLGHLAEKAGFNDKESTNHFVYEVPGYSVISRFLNDKKKFALKFRIYYRQRNHGPIHLWKFA